MDYAKIAEQFWEEGYIHIPGFIDGDKLADLDVIIQKHFGADPESVLNDEFIATAATEVVPWFPQREGFTGFDFIENDERLENLTTAILGEKYENQYCMIMWSAAGTSGQAWHQDCPPEGKFFNLNRLIYTADIQDEIGGQVVVHPKSHKIGELPVGDPHAAFDDQVVLKPKRGDLVLLHGHTWHRVLPVKTKYRSSTNFRAASLGAPEELTDICVYRNMRYQFSTSEVIVDRTKELA